MADPVPRTADELADRYVRLAFALHERDPLFLDLVFMAAPPASEDLEVREIAERAERLAASSREMARTGDEFRVRRIEASLRAMAFRARSLLGERRPVADELRVVFGLSWTDSEVDTERLHFRVDRALAGVAPLKVRVRRYYERSDVPGESAESRLREALAACRELALGTSAAMELEPLGIRWMEPAEALALPTGPSPFYRYSGDGEGALWLPLGLPLRSSELSRLACHEGVPGHHLQAVVADREYQAAGWPELGIVPLYGPRTAVFEGLAATLEGLFPAAPADESLRALEPVVSRVLAGYLDGELTRLEALRALDFDALVPDPHGLLAHADRFGGYALVRPSADPAFRSALESLIDPRLSPDERLSGIVRAVREAMSPEELIGLLSPTLHN
ncbi:MAG: DUF885 domain-containing protein [Acidobacteria bacterium]|nr:DUF885 domain-containing protein [Acidobacteriota bacterium]MYG76565.1 DUF885 domain-containing protein [Acidobacteriota bacterium]